MWTMCGLPTALCQAGGSASAVAHTGAWKLFVRGYAEISPELILQCARGFETMTLLYLPDGEVFFRPEFYHI